VNKRSGLERALARLGEPWGATAGIGDAENDLDFLYRCGLAAAVANALPEVKAAVDVVTEAAFGAGVAELVEMLLDPRALFPRRRAKRVESK
jgi:hypothetical protein